MPLEDVVIDVSGGGKLYQGKLISPLTPHRRKLLDDLNFIWDHHQVQWDLQYNNLKEFFQKHNHTCTRPSPTNYPSLAKWVRKHRAEYNNMENSTLLTPDRIEKLNQLQFQWVVRPYTWEDHYQHLIHFKQLNGHANPPQTYHDEDYHPKLGAWVTSQRSAIKKFQAQFPTPPSSKSKEYAKYQCLHERCEKLLQLGVILDAKFHKFETKYKEILRQSPSTWDKTTQKWISSLQLEYQNYLDGEPCKLDEKQLNLLKETNFSSLSLI